MRLPVVTSALSTPFAVRCWCTLAFLSAGSMLAVGAVLRPNSTGTGTHEQLGLPPCGFYHMTGIPCPTCGCTTAVSHFAHGHVLSSLITQPFGFTVALLGAIIALLALHGILTGKWIGPSMFKIGFYWRRWLYGGLGILLFAWFYKVTMVQLGYPV